MVLMAFVASSQVAAQTEASGLAGLEELRSTLMKRMGRTYSVFGPILQGKNSNVTDAVPAAATVNALAGLIVLAFPPGSGREAVPKTRAKPTVWTQRAEFEAAAARLVDESGKLITAAQSGDVAAFRTQFGAFVGACGGCHSGKFAEGGKFRFEKGS